MVRLTYFTLSALVVVGASAASAVLDLRPDNFDQVVFKAGRPALVKFFAPWCGHCKTLAPVFDELAAKFEHASDQLVIAKVDADEHKSLGRKYDVQGFPTLKWFDGKSVDSKPIEYTRGRDLESLVTFVSEKTGIKLVDKKEKSALPSNVVLLNDTTFAQEIGGDKHVLVAFTTPWCGHCKSLAPTWEKLANTFQAETEVLIAKIDAEAPNAKATAEEQGVSSYPTINYYPKGSTSAIAYDGGRTEEGFVEFINNKAGTRRAAGGRLDATGGTIAALDAVVEELLVAGKSIGSGLAVAKKAAKALTDHYVAYYLKVFEKMGIDNNYVTKEFARLEKLLKKGGLAPEKADDIIARSNILRKFLKSETADKDDKDDKDDNKQTENDNKDEL